MPKIHNHYVPKYYLKGFTEKLASEMMFVYQKGTKDLFHTQIKNIGNEKGLYTLHGHKLRFLKELKAQGEQ